MTASLSQIAVTFGLAGALAAIAWIDIRSLRIPDVLSLPLVAFGLLHSALTVQDPTLAAAVIGAVAGFALFAGLGEYWFRRSGTEALGLGDAKLFAAAGAWLGWTALPLVLLLASLGGIALALATRQRGPLPFGPALAVGFLAVWTWRLMAAA